MADSILGSVNANFQSANINRESSKLTGFEQAISSASVSKDDEKLLEAAREFESYFLQSMLKEMRATVPNDGLIPKGNAEEIFQSMLDEEYSKNAAKGRGMGIAQMIFNQMKLGNQMVIPPNLATNNPVAEAEQVIANIAVDATEEVDLDILR